MQCTPVDALEARVTVTESMALRVAKRRMTHCGPAALSRSALLDLCSDSTNLDSGAPFANISQSYYLSLADAQNQ